MQKCLFLFLTCSRVTTDLQLIIWCFVKSQTIPPIYNQNIVSHIWFLLHKTSFELNRTYNFLQGHSRTRTISNVDNSLLSRSNGYPANVRHYQFRVFHASINVATEHWRGKLKGLAWFACTHSPLNVISFYCTCNDC